MKGKELITLKREVTLQVPHQPAFSAIINDVEENIFWTNLPRDNRQVLVLLENQKVTLGISVKRIFYTAETTLISLSKDRDKFYGLTIPEELNESLQRNSIRAYYANNVLFKTEDLPAQTAVVNFSAGGVMVYFVPELEKIVKSKKRITLTMSIEGFSFDVEVRFAWKKSYDNIPFAGFEFVNLTPRIQGALAILATE